MPMPSSPSLGRMPGGIPGASEDLGLGTMLADQVTGETEEQRRRRLREMQQSQSAPPGTGQSAASLALFGGMGALG